MAANAEEFLTEWHRIVAAKDVEALGAVLAAEVAIGSPPYWEPLRGPDLVQHLLGIIINTIDDFTYHREFWRGGELALEFKGRVDGLDLQGIDLISLDEDNRLCHIDVLIRPINALEELQRIVGPQMMEFLGQRSS